MDKASTALNTDILGAKILVVDDEPINLRLVEKILATKGYRNAMFTSQPIDVVPLHQEHDFDLILLDINMPILDGFGVMDQLNAFTNDAPPPILILTAQHMQSFRQRALDNGARDYVTKPFDGDELLSRVRNLLEVQMAHRYMRNQNELLEEKVRERTYELQRTRLQVVRRLGMAAEYRDNETGLHIIRMSNMAVVLGRAAGMDDAECELLLNAAPMHDIGKLGIPDSILLKPGKFEPHEWEIMKTHVEIGASILEGDDSDLMRMAHDIALTHHEKWDGSGYPNGLKGNDIPLVGRVTALADVFDALTSKRPYKEAWPVEKAVALIREEKGRHFDPDLVDICLNNLQALVAIKEKYAEPDDSLDSAVL